MKESSPIQVYPVSISLSFCDVCWVLEEIYNISHNDSEERESQVLLRMKYISFIRKHWTPIRSPHQTVKLGPSVFIGHKTQSFSYWFRSNNQETTQVKKLTLMRLAPPFSQPIWYFFSGVWNASNSFVTPRWPSKIVSSTPVSPVLFTSSCHLRES